MIRLDRRSFWAADEGMSKEHTQEVEDHVRRDALGFIIFSASRDMSNSGLSAGLLFPSTWSIFFSYLRGVLGNRGNENYLGA